MFQFRLKYFITGLVIFIIEVIIALFVKDAIIRPHIGDLLVVIMIYCFIRAFFNCTVLQAAAFTLLFSYTIEILQYFKLVELLGLQKSLFARIVIGTHFSWIDMIAYTAGIIIVMLAEKKLKPVN
ncbi:MAG: DUF2809 domain-containing protein [Sphingobacteriaceae bacterium]|nr:MAG: DUF2809 domain-containing protein [Sphingobacteriaceae bacterium]